MDGGQGDGGVGAEVGGEGAVAEESDVRGLVCDVGDGATTFFGALEGGVADVLHGRYHFWF